jgi:hypothetical protein
MKPFTQECTFRFSEALLVTYRTTTRDGEKGEPKIVVEIEVTNAIALSTATDSPELLQAAEEHFYETRMG